MLNFVETSVSDVMIHGIGGKSSGNGVAYSKGRVVCDEEVEAVLLQYYTKKFKSPIAYSMKQNSSIYDYVSDYFAGDKTLDGVSMLLAELAHEVTENGEVKGGDIHIVAFNNVVADDEICNAIGIFIVESKDMYLKLSAKNEAIHITQDEGFSIKKLDRGCIILNTEHTLGFKSYVFGNESDSSWSDDFLNLIPRGGDYYNTLSLMGAISNFTQNAVDNFDMSVYDKSKTNAAALQLLKENVEIDIETLNDKLFSADVKMSEKFSSFTKDYFDNLDNQMPQSVKIDHTAVKKESGLFKSVIKLDKNFHIYVHANPSLMERGFDDNKKMGYYKLYFNQEVK
jgi:hypothetical protein